jgi:hypothetical protein
MPTGAAINCEAVTAELIPVEPVPMQCPTYVLWVGYNFCLPSCNVNSQSPRRTQWHEAQVMIHPQLPCLGAKLLVGVKTPRDFSACKSDI